MLPAMYRPKLVFCLASLLLCLALPMGAAELPCRPCAGLRLENPAPAPEIARLLKEGRLETGSPLFVAWETPMSGEGVDAQLPSTLRESGATPWLSLVFTTPAPVARNGERLQSELRAAADLAAKAPAGTWFQVVWRPEGAEGASFSPTDYGFLLKRAAVALTGARTDALVATQALPADPKAIQALYGEEVAAYLEAVALQAVSEEAIAAIQELDPGRPVVVDGPALPADPSEMLADAARNSTRGVDLTLFRAPALETTGALVSALSPLALLAIQFKGDLSYDPGSSPSGAAEAWAFARGEDLSLRVIALAPPGDQELNLRFDDPQLRRPTRFPIGSQQVPAPSAEVAGQGLNLRVASPGRVAVLGLDRPTAAEMEGVEEKVTVSSQREIPVEEILRRLQAFEDAQGRRLQHYSATNTTSLRFQPAAGTQTIEATLEGPFFFDPKAGGGDWAWQTLYVNGVKWRGKTLPEIPLIQPEKAAALPLEIHFSKQYRYRLRGSDTLDGREAWVMDFAPASGQTGKLYQGSVWVDKKLFARLRTRAVQIGLEGEVLSNEETLYYTPIDGNGASVSWGAAESYVLPLRLVAQQLLSVVNATTVVERETRLTNVKINGPAFEQARQEVEASDATMVRDTAQGLRYLVKNAEGVREVKEGYDTSKLFALGGVFYDDALDFPLPLAGINYFSFDFWGTGKQVNAFFGGALIVADIAEPRLFGSKFDAGADVFALAIPVTDSLYRDNREVNAEDVEQRVGTVGFKLGHPLGNFVKLGAEYEILYLDYGRAEDTADEFTPPSSNLTHSFELDANYARSGYRLSLSGSYSRRSEWNFWGLPGNPDYSEEKQDFLRWEARASKNWYLPSFQKVGVEVDYASGQDLDRFSKYQFGFFGGTRVHGYQSSRVRATDVYAAHGSYGFEIGQAFRLEGIGDVAWATDEDTGLDNELLAGLGVQGTFIGPWQTVVNLDLGVPVAGPDDGFVVYVVFLKLFK